MCHLDLVFELGLDLEFLRRLTESVAALTEPTASRPPDDLDAWSKTLDSGSFVRQVEPALARLAVEAWIGLVTTVERSRNERLTYIRRRIQNAWLLHSWLAVDERFGKALSPEREALYLTLGLTQAVTTWQWPWTERWRGLLGGSPPAHWLPRSQWHLSWLLHDPDNDLYRRGLDKALEEGLGDAERLQVAEALQSLRA